MQLFNLGSWTWLWEIINSLFLTLCNWVYILIAFLYKVFIAVAKVNLFDKVTFSKLTSRIYVVIGIAMLFIFAYNLILMIINPDDKKSTGAMTKVVKETMISLTLVILLPTIFNWLYIFQNNVLESNIIGKVILGGVGNDSADSDNCADGDYDCTCNFSKFQGLNNYIFEYDTVMIDEKETTDVREDLSEMCKNNKNVRTDSERGAKSIGSLLMSTFYKPTNFTFDECVNYLQNKGELNGGDEDKQICVNYFYDVTSSRYMGDTDAFVMDPYLRNIVSDSSKNSMEFNFIMALVAGIIAVYMFFCYTMEIGVRVAKLGVLQLISPIPVMMRIIPKQKEGIYDKWFNHLKNTYLDVFIRLMIIFFALFAISLVPDVIDTLFNSAKDSSNSSFISSLALVFVILGILKFAQEAPELIKDFFGNSGRFALKSPAKQLSENKLAMAGLGMAGGAVSGYVKNFGKGSAIAGGFSAGIRGARAGYKSNSFSSLRSNVSGAVDRAIQAREDRDDRQIFGRTDKTQERIEKYASEDRGFWSHRLANVLEAGAGIVGTSRYRAHKIGEGLEAWASGDSYAALSEKKNKASETEAGYTKAIEMVEGKLEENPTLYSIGGYSYDQYQKIAARAEYEYNNFNRQEYEKDHSIEETNKRLDELLEVSTAAQKNLLKVKEVLTDSILEQIQKTGSSIFELNGNEAKVNDNIVELIDLNKRNSEGKLELKHVESISSGKAIAGLSEAINAANNTYEKNSNLFRTETKNKVSDASIRDKRGAMKGEISNINEAITKMTELKNKDKK